MKKDDLLSEMIKSMNIYDNEVLINKLQNTIDIILSLINKDKKESKKIILVNTNY